MIIYEVQYRKIDDEILDRWLFKYLEDARAWSEKLNKSYEAKENKYKAHMIAVKLNVTALKPL